MKVLALIALAVIVTEGNINDVSDGFMSFLRWNIWKMHHNKHYNSEVEEHLRFMIFRENMKRIDDHNKKASEGKYSYYLKMYSHGDLMNEEFSLLMNGFRVDLKQKQPENSAATFIAPEGFVAPKEVDWRRKGAVTKIKQQGPCGSCWAFSATGSLEGQHFRKTGKLVSLSEQNLVDCSSSFGNHGCDGGFFDAAFKYVQANHGIDTEKSYPYQGMDEPRCLFSNKTIGATDKGYVDLPKGDEDALAKAVATVGPISVAIYAKDTFRAYSEGIYADSECNPDRVDEDFVNHAVLVVGYTPDYWIIKNSWGTDWGEEGYMKMKRGVNMCAIADFASYPLV